MGRPGGDGVRLVPAVLRAPVPCGDASTVLRRMEDCVAAAVQAGVCMGAALAALAEARERFEADLGRAHEVLVDRLLDLLDVLDPTPEVGGGHA